MIVQAQGAGCGRNPAWVSEGEKTPIGNGDWALWGAIANLGSHLQTSAHHNMAPFKKQAAHALQPKSNGQGPQRPCPAVRKRLRKKGASQAAVRPFFSGTAIQKVGDGQDGEGRSDHKAPPWGSALNVDPQIAAQVLVRGFAFEVAFAGVNVPVVSVVKVVLRRVVRHDVTSWMQILGFISVVRLRYKVRSPGRDAMGEM